MSRKAYSFVRGFSAQPARDLCVDRHYLLCASTGALRLAAADRVWLLPPARAALIEAGHPVRVDLPQPATTASVLFDTAFTTPPPAPLTVFDLSPLARALLAECGQWGASEEPLTAYAETLFAALAAVTWRLAEQPSPVVLPAGRSPLLRHALRFTGERLGGEIRFEEVAAEVGLAPRSLARRFATETGMTWRATLRRMRVLRAIEELSAADTPVTTIAHRVGYTSLSAFNAAFQELTGRTPTEYRASFRP
ncbi:helix-turn-helix transcriptional regulator [Micromonospora radicis]|uniref:AraC family transcriptional regulator n=1 Tax=Micromonospora radicis TaxID=1894971 RepID=A0A418MYW1_9ACTN|nr:AraC family transcriptional regulator [Micromonospora radicis]RIV39932.1 AraC family transcriptional regulator [Micromonospora radicis]